MLSNKKTKLNMVILLTAMSVLLSAMAPGIEAACVEPPSGLVGWWPGDGDADDIWSDNHGTLMNGATFAPGKDGQAFSLDGADDYIQIPYDVSFNLSSFTLQAWVKFTQDTYACIISRPQGGNPTDGYSFFRLSNSDGRIGGGVLSEWGPNISTSSSGSTFNDDTWHLCTFVHDIEADRMYIYVDEYGPWWDYSSPGGMEHNLKGINIGSYDGSKWFFEGLIDEVAIWNRALTATEILAIYNAGGMCKPENTPPGQDVEVFDPGTGTMILFDTVNSGGDTTITKTLQGQGPPPPSGFKLVPLGTYYEINTTAEFSGIVHIAIEYDDSGLTEGQENALKLRCYEEGEWVDKTTGLDTVSNIIYAETNHLSFFAITTGILVDIDIKPGSFPNSINPNAGGVIPVAILGTNAFDASWVDPATVTLEGANAKGKGRSGHIGSLEDVDGDGDLDLVIQIENTIEWADDATEATLTGNLKAEYGGTPIIGSDSVNIVPPEQ